MSKKVSFFCVGAAKAGTTSLHRYLEDNEVISKTRYKEPHFFTESNLLEKVYFKDIGEYHSNFLENDFLWADFSTSYLYSADAASKIYEYNKDAKVLIVLREPIERAISLYNHQIRSLLETKSMINALNSESDRIKEGFPYGFHYATSGLYSTQIERFSRIFPKENILIISFNDLIANTGDIFQDISEFINSDISTTYLPKENATGKPKSYLIQSLLEKNYPLKTIIKRVMGKRLLNKIRSINTGKKIKANNDEYTWLKTFYSSEPSFENFLTKRTNNEK